MNITYEKNEQITTVHFSLKEKAEPLKMQLKKQGLSYDNQTIDECQRALDSVQWLITHGFSTINDSTLTFKKIYRIIKKDVAYCNALVPLTSKRIK